MMVERLLDGPPGLGHTAIAVVDGDLELTYGELRGRTRRLATGLLGLGLDPGDRVLDLQRNSHSYLETDLAMLGAGLIRVPVNYRMSMRDKVHIARDAGARACVFGPEFAQEAAEISRECETVEILVGILGGPGVAYEDLIADALEAPMDPVLEPGTIVSLNYSSGTTGRPKGCIRTWRNRLASLTDMLTAMFEHPLGPEDVWLHAGPMTHASGLFVLPHLAVGARQVILREFAPSVAVEVMRRRRVTGTVLVPTMVERLIAEAPSGPLELPDLRRVVYAGAPMAPDRIRYANAILGGRMIQLYGMVEAIPPVTILASADHAVDGELVGTRGLRPDRIASAGRGVLGVELRVLDAEQEPVPPGEPGELVVGGDHVMVGYWGDESAGKSIVDGWLHTGDIVTMDGDGYVTIVDRKGNMIISGGYNIYPREVEDVLALHPRVAEALVLGAPDVEWGQRVTALVVLGGPDDGTADNELRTELLAHCRGHLSSFKLPKQLVFVAELPRGPTGKLAREDALSLAVAAG
jgi:acyl-CoA synthetase (AMP-forming)/AMP-acid ligase II